MEQRLNQAGDLVDAGHYEEAVGLLCRQGPPENTRVCELIATAYHHKDQTRGDVHAALMFARLTSARAVSRDASWLRSVRQSLWTLERYDRAPRHL